MSAKSLKQTLGRLAPSPTGGLHVGHARTFLIAWLAAKSAGGRTLLRIEDIDASRVRPGATEAAVADLDWLGLTCDLGPYVQSRRLAAYEDALGRLKALNLVYPCVCTRAEIERAASAPHAGEDGPVYPGTCSSKTPDDAEALAARGRSFAWRFRTPSETIAWDDLFLGRVEYPPERLGGDFIVARHPFAPSYQLAVVHDDATMEITEVVRGDDLVPSTPRQIPLHRALGFEPPRFGHVPLVLDADGKRLAKRDGSIKLSALREAGVSAEELVGRLARSCGWSDRIEPSRPVDWVERFSWSTQPREGWRFTPPPEL